MNDIYCMHTNDLWGVDAGLEADFCAVDPERPGATERERYIGRVYQIPHGPGKVQWFWTMTCTKPGARSPFPTRGREERRGDAGRRVIECYRRMASFYDVPRPIGP